VIGFGGRILGDGQPKYLNSPETPLFSKGRELYGLLQAREAIRAAGKVVVVEGYMDVVALAQHGVPHVVATLGTATTPAHVQKLFRLTDTVVFCFDGDAAGRKAAWRALENVLPALADGKNVRFLLLPGDQDPDDFIRAKGKAAFEALVDRATPLSEFLLQELAVAHPPSNAEHRAALISAARPLLAQLQAPVLGALIRRQLAELSGLPEAELRGLLQSAKGSMAGYASANKGSGRSAVSSRRAPSLLRELIQALLLQPELARTIAIPQPDDGTPEAAALCALGQFCTSATGPLSTPGTIQHFAGSAHEAVLAAALATAHDHSMTAEQAKDHLRAGVDRYWLQAERNGVAVQGTRSEPATAPPPEEVERLRQLELVRRLAGHPARPPHVQ
jgi:DNA primase